MAIKVNDISTVNQVPEATKTVEGDGSFKFTLASAITDADLQAKVDELLSDITAQGNRLAEHMDIRDMKKYRGLIIWMNWQANWWQTKRIIFRFWTVLGKLMDFCLIF